ncbi:MAG: FxLYD domain-containing protein [Chloroflexi bacterium]|nr:FxLYD domain-containing protein [Chloroflexota bacterium]
MNPVFAPRYVKALFVAFSIMCVSASGAPSEIQPRAWLPVVSQPSCLHGVTVQHIGYGSNVGGTWVAGEVCNGTQVPISNARVTVNLLNNDQQVDTASAITLVPTLRPGESTCFHFFFGPQQWTRYQIEPVTYSPQATVTTILSITTVIDAYDPLLQEYWIYGSIWNVYTATIKFPRVVMTLYDNNKAVLSCFPANVNVIELGPGGVAAFSEIFHGPSTADITSYRLQPIGNVVHP